MPKTKYTLRSRKYTLQETKSGQDDRTDRLGRPQALRLPRGTQGQAARGRDRGAGDLRGQQPYQEHRRRLRSRRLSRRRAGVLRPRAARRRPRLFAGGHRSRPHLHPEDELGQRDQGRGRGKGRGEVRRESRNRRLLLGRDGVVDGGGAPRGPGVRRVLLRRRHPEQRRRETEVPGDVPLGRDRPVDPDRLREEGRGAAPGRAVLRLSGGARLQLRPARLLPRREREARALALAGILSQAHRVERYPLPIEEGWREAPGWFVNGHDAAALKRHASSQHSGEERTTARTEVAVNSGRELSLVFSSAKTAERTKVSPAAQRRSIHPRL